MLKLSSQRRNGRKTNEARSARQLLVLPSTPINHKPSRARTAADNLAASTFNPRFQNLIRQLIGEIGENVKREGLVRTPARVAKAWEFLTSGYHSDVMKILNGALFEEQYNEMVIVKDIDFYSLCEHHLLPFYGKCHVAYVPNGRVVGLSKIPRIVDVFARRLQVQERMTNQIAKTLMEVLQPAGVAVVTEARHLCMMMRGVQKQNTVVTNSAVLGIFHEDRACRDEFMQLIGHRQMG
jgi:GTP cyclohydrolase I